MPSGDGARSPRQLLALFLGTTFVLLAALGWLGWQSLQQDRRVEAQLVRDRLESATDVIAAQIRQNLTDTEEQLSRLAAVPAETLHDAASDYAKRLGDDALLAVFDPPRVTAYPIGRLLYYPVLPEVPDPPAGPFAFGEALEFKDRDFRSATAFFERLGQSNDASVRAGALLRLARNQRKAGRSQAALETYATLATVSGAFLGGWPADLRARKTRCDLLEQLGQRADLQEEAERLDRDLHSGRWPLTRSTFLYLTSEVRRWLTDGPPAPRTTAASAAATTDRRSVALALAANVDSLWERWQRDPTALDMLRSERSVVSRESSVSLLWRATTNRLVALVSGPGFLDHHLVAPLHDLLERHNVGIVLADVEGQTLLAYKTAGANEALSIVRTMADTRLPWTLRVASADPEADVARLAARRWLLIGSLGFLALLAVAGSYFSVRAMTREIKAARLQSEFVAAVSHEFRTPLTSLRQFSDLLADGRVSNEADRQKYYAALQRGTRRLTRLVENLLDFGRMEAGFYRFVLEPVRARDLVDRVTSEFGEEVRQRGYHVELGWTGSNEPLIKADEAALGRALWNLLDNAVKYSPDCKTVWVDGTAANGSVAISVRDRGIGIAAPEQRAIFVKFVRGSLPSGYTIKGTGLGLALVDQIVQAHGGKVTVMSAPGEGSVFTIVLPLQPTESSPQRDAAVAEART
jgi:signal transduction histidine kinase